jgi:hypothetical protein
MRTFAALLLTVAACGGSTDPAGGQSNSCTATLSGAVTASNVVCFANAGTDGNGSSNGAVAFSFTQPTGLIVVAGVKTLGTPTTRTYANTDANANGACEVTQSNNGQLWAAVAGGSSPPPQGTYSLTLSSMGNEVTNPDGGPGNAFLSVHGTLNCTMPAFTATGASGTVTLTANF